MKNRTKIKKIFNQLEIDVLNHSPLKGGLMNEMHLINSNDQKYVLRIAKSESNRLSNETNAYKLLEKSNIRVPNIIQFDETKKIIPYTYSILEFIEGPIAHKAPNLDGQISLKYSSLLSDMHGATEIFHQAVNCELYAKIHSELELLKKTPFKSFVKDIKNDLNDKKIALEELVPFGFIHGDYSPSNTIVENKDTLVPIDLEWSSKNGNQEKELVEAYVNQKYFFPINNSENISGENFFKSYFSNNELSESFLDRAHAYALVQNMNAMNWYVETIKNHHVNPKKFKELLENNAQKIMYRTFF